MCLAWNEAIQEFSAMTAAINAAALMRADLLLEADRKSMLVFLMAAKKVARTPDQRAIVYSLHHLLDVPIKCQNL